METAVNKNDVHKGHRERQTEKILQKNKLSNHEILEILLFYAIPRKDVNELAHSLLNSFGSLKRVFEADAEMLKSVKGVGDRTAAFLIAIGRCIDICAHENEPLPQRFSYDDFKPSLIAAFKPFSEEKFVAFYLDTKGKILLRKIFSNHSPSYVEIKTDELLKGVFSVGASAVVVCHNHLSGDPNPSYSDDRATAAICGSLLSTGVRLADHIIVAGENTFSYRASGRLDKIDARIQESLSNVF